MRAKMAIDNSISSASNSKLEEGDLKNTSGVFDSSNTMHSYSLVGAALNLMVPSSVRVRSLPDDGDWLIAVTRDVDPYTWWTGGVGRGRDAT